MATIISENYQSRTFSIGSQSARELIYDVFDDDNSEENVETVLAATAPEVYYGLVRESVSGEPVGAGWWKGYVRYIRLDAGEFSFDTSGGNIHITQSRSTIASYAPPGFTAPDFQGAIGVSDDRVEGVDIPGRAYVFAETYRMPAGIVTGAYRRNLFLLTGRYNSAPFKGFAYGECLLLGVSGSQRQDEDWSLTFRFAGSPNETNIQIGDITVASKYGWDYLWVRYADFEDSLAYALVKRPVAAYVERVLEPGDMSLLGIGI